MNDLTHKAELFAATRMKRAKKKFLSELLNSYAPGDRVRPEDEPVLRMILSRHPDVAQKCAGQGISHFKVDKCTGGTQCFYLVRDDGTEAHFSFLKCL